MAPGRASAALPSAVMEVYCFTLLTVNTQQVLAIIIEKGHYYCS